MNVLARTLFLVCLNYRLHFANGTCANFKLHCVAMPLVGGPTFLKLHHAAIFESVAKPGNNVQYQLMDYLPVSPEKPSTLLKLLSGNSVSGMIRSKKVSSWPVHAVATEPPIIVSVDLTELEGYLKETYDMRLLLLRNDCRTFVDTIKLATTTSADAPGLAHDGSA